MSPLILFLSSTENRPLCYAVAQPSRGTSVTDAAYPLRSRSRRRSATDAAYPLRVLRVLRVQSHAKTSKNRLTFSIY